MQRLGFLFLVFIFGFNQNLFAGEILRQKGKKVIVDVRGENVKAGDNINVYQNSRRRGVIRIQKLNKNGTKALAVISLGSAKKGWIASKNAPSDTKIKGATTVEKKQSSAKKIYYGGMLGFSIDSMTISIGGGNPEVVDLSGTGFSIKALADYRFSNTWQARIKSGLETFEASGSPSILGNCPGNDCSVEINYFTVEGLIQYYFSKDKYSFWLGGGGAIAHPLSSSSNAIDADGLSTTSALQVGGGMDIKLKSGSVIPVEFLYSLLPKSDSVEATYITISVGYLF